MMQPSCGRKLSSTCTETGGKRYTRRCCHLLSLVVLYYISLCVTIPSSVCEARYHSTTTSSSRRYIPLAGIFGFNNEDHKKKSQQQLEEEQHPHQQQYPNGFSSSSKQHNNNDERRLIPPRPLSSLQPGAGTVGTTFVRSTSDQNNNSNNPQTLVPPQFRTSRYNNPPPPPNQQQQTQVVQKRENPSPPPPPPPRPPKHFLEKEMSDDDNSNKEPSSLSEQANNDIESNYAESDRNTKNVTSTLTSTTTNEISSKDNLVRTVDTSIQTSMDGEKSSMIDAGDRLSLEKQQPSPVPQQWEDVAVGSDSSQSINSYYQTEPQQSTYESPEISWSAQQNQRYYYDQQQRQYPSSSQSSFAEYDTSLFYLQEELSESLARESSLVSQLDNITSTALVMEQREELHTRQLDVLTERVMDVESQSAEDRNLLFEYEANCTTLGMTIIGLKEDLEGWQDRCKEYNKKHEDDQERLSDLRQTIKEKVSEAEELAIAMEQLRMTEENRRELSSSGRRGHSHSKSGGGLLSWMFGSLGFGSSSNNRYDEELREEAFEMAKSTLLRALQAERTNVHELEAAVASLQQNNSAISEMVESRDIIIDELNNRIAVFEEDKVVLKAALRQLQKEMKEEEPKTQKLIDDLAEADQEVERIKSDVHSVIETHQYELAALQITMSQKQKTITYAESNLTAIGTYVDKLEERLTSFAMTRRDMEEREKKCKEIEKNAEEKEIQRKSIQMKVEEFQKQEDDLKKLLEELVSERTDLQEENRRVYTEQEFRIGEQEHLKANCKILEGEAKSMRDEIQELKATCESLVPELESSRKCQLDLEREVEILKGSQDRLHAFQIEYEGIIENNEKLQEEIAAALEEKDRVEAILTNMTNEVVEKAEVERVAEEKAEAERAVKKLSIDEKATVHGTASEEEIEIEQSRDGSQLSQPPPPPMRPPHLLSTQVSKQNDVPLRSLRKTLSKATGLHGVLTPSSKMIPKNVSPSGTHPRPGLNPDDIN